MAVTPNEILQLLFEPGEYICTGNQYANKVCLVNTTPCQEFFSLNPLHPAKDYDWEAYPDRRNPEIGRRADVNVTVYRNFLFEMDNIDLNLQKQILFKLKDYFASLVYSGGKSIHAVISLKTPLELLPHTYESTYTYGKIWEKLSGFLTEQIHAMGYVRAEGKRTFFDAACKNASRLSRFPGAKRNNGATQEILFIGSKLSDEKFKYMVRNAPKVYKPVISSREDCYAPQTVEQFMRVAPRGIKSKIESVDFWADGAGMYPEIFRLCLWCIDDMKIDKEIMEMVLQEHVYPVLLRKGYPRRKLNNAIKDAFKSKRNL